MTDDVHLDEQLSERQHSLMRTVLFERWDWHHSEGRAALAEEYQELLEIVKVDEADDDE